MEHRPPPRPGHYCVKQPGFEREPDVEHVDDHGAGLVVQDDSGAWVLLESVWGGVEAQWWRPLVPPVCSST